MTASLFPQLGTFLGIGDPLPQLTRRKRENHHIHHGGRWQISPVQERERQSCNAMHRWHDRRTGGEVSQAGQEAQVAAATQAGRKGMAAVGKLRYTTFACQGIARPRFTSTTDGESPLAATQLMVIRETRAYIYRGNLIFRFYNLLA